MVIIGFVPTSSNLLYTSLRLACRSKGNVCGRISKLFTLSVKMRFLIYADNLDVFIPRPFFYSLIIEIDLIVPAEKRH